MYDKFEATYSLGNTYSNPYDPSNIDVNVDFTSPSGKHYNVNGFIYQSYTRTGDFNSQNLLASGPLVWKVRFSPNEEGSWSYQISAFDGVTNTAAVRQFTVNSSSKKGFIRISSYNSRYFAYDNGENYFPLGEGMGWPGSGGTYQYDTWVSLLAAAGGNYIRVWNAPWHTEVEWAYSYPSSPVLPGNYSSRQAEAWELDHIFDLADSNGVKVLLCMINHGKFSSTINPNWDSNPYNSNVNPNGLIATPQEVWTNASVQIYLKRVWRYYVARYAYSTALFSWELWNEMEWSDDYLNQVANSALWHQASADYFRSIDPYKHLVTTSYAHATGWPVGVWNSGMDFTQDHNYGGTDMASYIHGNSAQMMQLNPGKPFMQEELGISTENSGADLDPTGLSIHESNWASVMSGCGGGAMPWWWDTWIHPGNLYYRWTGTAKYLKNENLDSRNYSPVTPIVQTAVLSDYILSPGFTTWNTKAPQNIFAVSNSGFLTPPETNLGDRLYGAWYNAAKNPPTFNVNYPSPGKFRVTDVQENPASNNSANSIRIDLDGVSKLSQNPTAMGNIYEIDVPAGAHTIFVTNTGNDWIVVNYAFTNYTGLLRCYALSGNQKILGWVQNRNYTYWQQHNNVVLTTVTDGLIRLKNVSNDGIWRVYWWDTESGIQNGGSSDFNAVGGDVNINVPPVSKDAAFKAYFIGTPMTPFCTPTITPTADLSTPTPGATATPVSLNGVRIYPSFVNFKSGDRTLTFSNLTQNCVIRIYNLNGELVFSVKTDSPNGKFIWTPDKKTASGVFAYFIRDENGNTVKGKFAIAK
jgi:hypothetical protein